MNNVSKTIRTQRFLLAALSAAACLGFTGAHAQSKEPVVIATFPGETAKLWREAVAAPFEKSTGIPTKIFEVSLPSAAMAAAKGQPPFHAGIVGSYGAANIEDKIEHLTPEDVPNIKDIPEKYWVRTSSGKLAGVPIYFSYLGIAYNTDLAKASDFPSWTSLADPKWKGKLSVARPVIAGAYDLTMYAKIAGGDEKNYKPGLDLLSKVSSNAINVYTSMATVMAQLGRGEIVAAPFYSTQVALIRKAGVKNVDLTIPKEGGLQLSYLLVIPKGTKNLEAAKQLLNAVISPEYQSRLIPGGIWPMNPKTKPAPGMEKQLGMTLEEALARNYAPDWWTVGKNIHERARAVEEIVSK